MSQIVGEWRACFPLDDHAQDTTRATEEPPATARHQDPERTL
jgi:hypothetical protein